MPNRLPVPVLSFMHISNGSFEGLTWLTRVSREPCVTDASSVSYSIFKQSEDRRCSLRCHQQLSNSKEGDLQRQSDLQSFVFNESFQRLGNSKHG